jgi:biopolymer transport protein ExbB/TolQ
LDLQIWIAFVFSGIVIAAMSVIFYNVTKRWGVNVNENKADEMRAGTVAWYLYGTMVSQGN